MNKHVTIPANEAADRLAIREIVEAYAQGADRRDAKGQMSLFTADTHFVVCMNAKDPTPLQELHSREALAPMATIAASPAKRFPRGKLFCPEQFPRPQQPSNWFRLWMTGLRRAGRSANLLSAVRTCRAERLEL